MKHPAHEKGQHSASFGILQERLSKGMLGALHGVGFSCLVSLRAKVGSSRAALGKEAGENRLNEGTEDDLGATIVVSLITCLSGEMVSARLTRFAGGPSTRRGRT